MIDTVDLKNLIEQARQRDVWALGNNVLYEMCKRYPKHSTVEEVVAKIWLIGRSYAASIERRKQKIKDDKINDDFYVDAVAPTIIASGIDEWMEECRQTKSNESVLKTHKKTTELFKNISGLEKRSLASKYLHFHLPELFYIYDSRVVAAIGRFLKHFDKIKTDLQNELQDSGKYDKEYTKYFFKCEFLKNTIKTITGARLTCRELDNLLISAGNSKLRTKPPSP